MIGRRPHVPQRRESDIRVIRHDDHVAIEREVRSSGQTMAMDLGNRGLVHLPEGSHASLKTLQHPAVIVDPPTGSPLHTVIGTGQVARRQIITR